MNATRLAGRKATHERWITLVDPTGVERNMLALVDQEWMLIGSTIAELIGTSPPRPTVGVVPGYDGTPAGHHAQQATVILGRPNEFQTIGLIPGSVVVSQSFTWISGAPFTWITGPSGLAGSSPIANTIVNLTTGTAGTQGYFQLTAPTPDQTNTLLLVSGPATGNANVQYNPGFLAGGLGQLATIAPGFVFAVKAQNGTWVPVASADGGVGIS